MFMILYANGSPLRIKLRTLTQLKLLSNFYIATFATFEPSCISRESDGVQKFPDLFVVGPFKAHQLKLLDRHIVSRGRVKRYSRNEKRSGKVLQVCGLTQDIGTGQLIAAPLDNMRTRCCDRVSDGIEIVRTIPVRHIAIKKG